MCVRACDGYYYPIRQNALAKDFEHDAATCAATCSGEARLFYFSRQGGRPSAMIDRDGRKYTDEPNAFAYRRAFNPACTCRPQPWTLASKKRHDGYAQASRERVSKLAAIAARAMAAQSVAVQVAVAPRAASKPTADAMGEAVTARMFSVAEADTMAQAAGDAGRDSLVRIEAISMREPKLARPRYRIQQFGRPSWTVFGAANAPDGWPTALP